MRLKRISNGNCSRAESASCTRFAHQFFFINLIDDYHLNLNHLHCAMTYTQMLQWNEPFVCALCFFIHQFCFLLYFRTTAAAYVTSLFTMSFQVSYDSQTYSVRLISDAIALRVYEFTVVFIINERKWNCSWNVFLSSESHTRSFFYTIVWKFGHILIDLNLISPCEPKKEKEIKTLPVAVYSALAAHLKREYLKCNQMWPFHIFADVLSWSHKIRTHSQITLQSHISLTRAIWS